MAPAIEQMEAASAAVAGPLTSEVDAGKYLIDSSDAAGGSGAANGTKKKQ